jgi:hypothetical protein
MRRRDPTEAEREILERFENADGVVRHVFWTLDPGDDTEEGRRRVATASLAEAVGSSGCVDLVGAASPPAKGTRISRELFLREYRRAVTDPPYGLFGDDPDALYAALVDVVLGGVGEDAVIFAWSDEHAFFDAGREWWGTFFFTISIEGGAAGIVASETD